MPFVSKLHISFNFLLEKNNNHGIIICCLHWIWKNYCFFFFFSLRKQLTFVYNMAVNLKGTRDVMAFCSSILQCKISIWYCCCSFKLIFVDDAYNCFFPVLSINNCAFWVDKSIIHKYACVRFNISYSIINFRKRIQ